MSNTMQDYSEFELEALTEKANGGDVAAQAELGFRFYTGVKGAVQNFETSVEWSRKAADQGNARAKTNLGLAYYQGRGVVKNFETAVELYRQAVARGSVRAKTGLGIAYYEGRGVEKSFGKAVELYRQAVEQGDAPAKNNLGLAYCEGQGVDQNFETAAFLLKEAAQSRVPLADLSLVRLFCRLKAHVSDSLGAEFNEEVEGQQQLLKEVRGFLEAYRQQLDLEAQNAIADSLEYTGGQ